jgi:ribose 1,5-bisphosphokinase
MTGLLVLVVGPSGSGKDTLMAGAAETLAADPRFRFVRRVVTRPASTGQATGQAGGQAGEDHEVADAEGFAARRDAGGFALHWEAHGLQYGIPADIADDLAAGRAVVANISRGALAEAAARFPTVVIEITVPDWVRAARLSRRGREAPADVVARLARDVPRPEGLPVFTIVNDGTIADGIAALLDFFSRLSAEIRTPDHDGSVRR